MTLPASGPLSLSQMNAEFGGGGSLSSYYAGGGHVPNPTGSVPASGALSFSKFLGTQNAIGTLTVTIGTDGSDYGFFAGVSEVVDGFGSCTPNDSMPFLETGPTGTLAPFIVWYGLLSGGFGVGISLNLAHEFAAPDQSAFTSITINGTTLTSASAHYLPDDGNGAAMWAWNVGNILGTTGTVVVAFH